MCKDGHWRGCLTVIVPAESYPLQLCQSFRDGSRILDFFFHKTCRPLPPYRAIFNIKFKYDPNGHHRGMNRFHPPFYLLWNPPQRSMNQANPNSDGPTPIICSSEIPCAANWVAPPILAECSAYCTGSLPVLPTINFNAATASVLVNTFQPSDVPLTVNAPPPGIAGRVR